MREVGIEQARKILGDLVNEVRYSGRSIVLTRNGTPVARLAPLEPAAPAPRTAHPEES
ncbi:type II toxin-antitoxin system Phd/YefM family antitoxin [Streptomyces beihaiensis]|uniref:type II toxin-antitoxin system Phd/YefM family antitoxin n=1 Tax=Streptomyces beihaiensis TaxID=2984495 RepID=UPI00389AD94A